MTILSNHPFVLADDVASAAASLNLALARHPELAALPFSWEVGGGTVRPAVERDHPETLACVRALAEALDLPLFTTDWTALDGTPHQTLHVEGRWVGADWSCVAYRRAGEAR